MQMAVSKVKTRPRFRPVSISLSLTANKAWSTGCLYQTREPLLEGVACYSWPPWTNKFRSAHFI